MSTSFSTMRSSNCWILKSFRLKAVLHSGQAAEGLVNSVSTQDSHLVVKTKTKKKKNSLLFLGTEHIIMTINAKTLSFQYAVTWFLLESLKQLTTCGHTHSPEVSTWDSGIWLFCISDMSANRPFSMKSFITSSFMHFSLFALSCSQKDNVGSRPLTKSILIGWSK